MHPDHENSMHISSETLRIVRLVARYQSLTLAAERANKVPSAISYTVRKLEETLGVELFQRRGSHIELTAAGEYFVDHSKNILDDLEALQRNTALAHHGVEQELRIAVNNIVPRGAIVAFIAEFEANFPSTRLVITQEVYNGCWDALYGKRADLVIGAPHAVPTPEGIRSEALGQMHWAFIVGTDHPLASAEQPLHTNDLRRYPALCIRDTATTLAPQFAWLLDSQKSIVVPDFATAIELIEQSVGIGYVPRYLAAPSVASGRTSCKPMHEHKHPTQLFLAYRADGLGKVRQWCVEYLTQPERREHLCGSPGTPPVC